MSNRRARLPRALSSSFVLPTLAAGALVVTATGATVTADAKPLTLDLDGTQTAMARTAQRKAAAKAKAEREGRRWVRPIKVWNITSDFGWRWGKTHDGIDLGASTGTPIYAMSKGVVIGSFYDSSFGNKVEIKYWDGSISWYGHMSKRIAQEGDTVMPGELVGLVGNTGHSFGSHLHLEFQRTESADTPIDPIPWLKRHGLD